MFFKIENGQITNRSSQPLDVGDWRKVVIVSRPSFDPLTQKETPSFNILPDKVEVTYTISANVIDLSAGDLATLNAELAAPGSFFRGLAALYRTDMNLIAAGSKPPNRTVAQFLAAVQAGMR